MRSAVRLIARIVLPLLLLSVPGPLSAADSDWRGQIAACAAEFEAQIEQMQESTEPGEAPYLDVSVLEAICPGLAVSLEEHPWRSLLERSPGNWTVGDAQGLLGVQEAYEELNAVTSLRPENVDAILADLPLFEEDKLTLWDRLMSWLSEKLGDEEGGLPDWWPDVNVASWVFDWILYVCIALVVLLAVGVVVNEVIQHRKGRRRAADPAAWQTFDYGAETGLTFADVQRAPLWEQPGMLLELLVRALQKQDRQRHPFLFRPGMTPRKIVAVTRNLPQTEVIGELAAAAERATYGGWKPEPDDMETLRQHGEAALHDIEKGA